MCCMRSRPIRIPSRSTNLWKAGIRHFDTASLGEIEIVQEPVSRRHLPFHGAGAPARPGQGGVREAWRHRFVVDSDSELDKLLAETGNPKKLRIFVRLVAQLGGALLEMSSKYGCRPEEAAKLLQAGAGLPAPRPA